MRKSKSEELATLLAPLTLFFFQKLVAMNVPLTMAQMRGLIEEIEQKAVELTANGNGDKKGGES